MPEHITWVFDTLRPRLRVFEAALVRGLDRDLEEAAHEVQDYAQENAPWEDQTGAAREGLTAEAGRSGRVSWIELAHGVDYGIWLEVRFDGKFAIILPTLEAMGPKVMAELDMGSMLAHGYT